MSPPRQIIWDAAGQHGIDDGLIWIPLTISWGESSWKVDAGGDGGESIGLFQINDIHGISKEDRMDGVYNANWIMPQMKRFIDKGVEKGLKGEELLKYVWYNVEKPYGYNSNYALGYDPNTTDPDALAGLANMESAYQAASSGTIDVKGKGPLEYHGLGGGTSTGDADDLLDDPLEQANIDYLDAQTKYLKDNFGLSFAQFQQAKLEFQATLSLSTDQFEEGKRQFEKTFGLSLLQFFEAQNQFDKTFALDEAKFAYQKESDFANLSARLLETSMTDRRAAAQQQSELFRTLQPFMVDKEGKIAASIGRKFRGITGGGSMPTMKTPYDPTLSQPADMDAMTRSAQEQALRFMAGSGGGTDEPAATGTQPTPEQIALAAQMGIRVEDLMASVLKAEYGAVVRMPKGGTVSPSSPHWSDTRPVGAGMAGKSFQIKPKQSINNRGQMKKMRQPFEGWNTIPTGYASGGTVAPASPKGGYGTFNTEKTGLETYLDGMDKIVQGPGGGGSAGVALPGDGIPSMNKVRNTFGQPKGIKRGPAGASPGGGLFASLAGQKPFRAHLGTYTEHRDEDPSMAAWDYDAHIAELDPDSTGDTTGDVGEMPDINDTDAFIKWLLGIGVINADLAGSAALLKTLGDVFGFIPPALVDQLFSTLLDEGETLGMGGQTQAAMEWEKEYAASLLAIGVEQQKADNIAAQTAALLEANKLDNATKLQVAEIQAAASEVTALIAAGATVDAANIAAEAQTYVADLSFKIGEMQVELGYAELGLGYEELNFTKAATLSELQANPRKIFEAIALQSNMQPSQYASDVQADIFPNWSDYDPAAAPTNPNPPSAASGATVKPYMNNMSRIFQMADGGKHEQGPTMLIVGDKGNKGNKARATEEYVFTMGPTVVAPAIKGEEMTMDNAIRAVTKQMKGAPVRAATGGIFATLAGREPIRAAHGHSGQAPGWSENPLWDADSGNVNWDSLSYWVDAYQNFTPTEEDQYFGAVAQFEAAFPEYMVTPGAPGGWQGDTNDTYFDWDAFMADFEGGLFGDPATGFFGEPGTMDSANEGAPNPEQNDAPLGQQAIDLAGDPLANQMTTTGLYNALGGGTPEVQEWFNENFGGLPTVKELNRLSPTQQGVWEGMVSANMIDPQDILAQVGTQFVGFGPKKNVGQTAGVSFG